jgi:hypothetical protein
MNLFGKTSAARAALALAQRRQQNIIERRVGPIGGKECSVMLLSALAFGDAAQAARSNLRGRRAEPDDIANLGSVVLHVNPNVLLKRLSNLEGCSAEGRRSKKFLRGGAAGAWRPPFWRAAAPTCYPPAMAIRDSDLA